MKNGRFRRFESCRQRKDDPEAAALISYIRDGISNCYTMITQFSSSSSWVRHLPVNDSKRAGLCKQHSRDGVLQTRVPGARVGDAPFTHDHCETFEIVSNISAAP